ncbi:unnamed protein product, partial [Meganyctiphanes norvegica]
LVLVPPYHRKCVSFGDHIYTIKNYIRNIRIFPPTGSVPIELIVYSITCSDMKDHVLYVSGGVNQGPNTLDWGSDDTICYGSSNKVLLYKTKTERIIGSSPPHHNERITSVRWVRPEPSNGPTLISTSSDKKAIVWTVSAQEINGLLLLKPLAVLDHSKAVQIADASVIQYRGEENVYVVTVTIDGLHFWLVSPETGEFESCSSYKSSSFILSVRFFMIDKARWPGVAYGGHDGRIHILTAEEPGVYVAKAALSGHQDWLTGLDVMKEDSGSLMVASGSKDGFVRLWKFSIEDKEQNDQEEYINKDELQMKSLIVCMPSAKDTVHVKITMEAVLMGHEGLVSQVQWAPREVNGNESHQPLRLLTCSKTQDRALIMWEPEGEEGEGEGIWVEVARLGEVGGNMEGFYCCQFSPDMSQILGVSYLGGIHLWNNEMGVGYKPAVVIGGHFAEVVDIAWDTAGRYLLSASRDQTTRLHGPWIHQDSSVTWHEVGRPQVHGYDMACIAALKNLQFASGAEEKVIRAFTAPANFIKNFGQICKYDVSSDLESCNIGEGAAVPSLGLSNKAIHKEEVDESQESQDVIYFHSLQLTSPPTEDQLMQNTLWAEVAKLYGHGNELFTMGATADGEILATACRAQAEADASIIIWDTLSWTHLAQLKSHRLTVTQLAFSPNKKHLLSVSRDRTWAIFTQEDLPESGITYKLEDSSRVKSTMHSRIIWSCAWLPDSSRFATASRDKSVRIWKQEEKEWMKEAQLNKDNEITAIAVRSVPSTDSEGEEVFIALGLVNGEIHIHKYNYKTCTFFEEFLQLSHVHHKTVRRLQFKPSAADDSNSHPVVLASCGDDKAVHLYNIYF